MRTVREGLRILDREGVHSLIDASEEELAKRGWSSVEEFDHWLEQASIEAIANIPKTDKDVAINRERTTREAY